MNAEDTRPSRRSVGKGVAWALPAVMIGAPAPAMAASQPSTKFAVAFDGGSGANGFLQSVYLNFGLAPGEQAPFTLTSPVTVHFNVVGLLAGTTDQRDFSASTSDGTLSRGTYDATTKSTPFTWIIPAGFSITTIGTDSSLPDVLFSFRDGLTGAGRLTDKIVVTSVTGANVTSPSAPPVDSSVVKDYNKSGVSPDGIY